MKPTLARWILLGLSLACAVVFTLTSGAPAFGQSGAVPGAAPTGERPPLPYDEAADPQRDLREALSRARVAGKRVLVVFGANWCPDCRILDREFHAGGRTANLVSERYEVVKVDVGRFDRNLDFAKLYGEPIMKGIPSVVIVTPTNEIVYQTKAGELADARAMGPDGIYGFFKDKADRPTGS